MKLLLVTLTTCLSLTASAVEVTATGVGVTSKRAIADAKNVALEQVTGVSVVHHATSDGRNVQERTAQYSGGVVRKYTVASTHYDGQMYKATIVAEVDPSKDNNIISPTEVDLTQQSQMIQEHADRYENVERIGKALDVRSNAFAVVPPKIEYSPTGEYTTVRVTVGVTLQPKWIDDVRMMSKEAGAPIDVSTSVSDILWGVGTVAAPFSLVGSSIVRSAAQFSTNRQPKSYTASNCFSKNNSKDVDECYAVGYILGNVVRNDRFLVTVTLWSGSQLVQELPVAVLNNNTLYALHDNGTRLYFRTSAKERRFHSRGVVWFTEGVAIGTNTYQINTQKLATVDRMEYNLK